MQAILLKMYTGDLDLKIMLVLSFERNIFIIMLLFNGTLPV